MPKYAKEGDSGFDLRACKLDGPPDDYGNTRQYIHPGETATISVGVRAEIPEGYEIQIRPRSGKTREGIVAQFGTIDTGYRGEWKVNLLNTSDEIRVIHYRDAVAQAVLAPVTRANIVEGVVSTDTERGEAGFGSTGV
jgi:dUTP pyrophosphatase